MLELYWHKLDNKAKTQIRNIRPLALLGGFPYMDQKQFDKIIRQETSKGTLIICILDQEWIKGLENSEQFRPASEQAVKTLLKNHQHNTNIALLHCESIYFKYIVRELHPTTTLLVNGSWANVLNYQPEYWEIIDAKSDIQLLSPFASETSAKAYSSKIYKQSAVKLIKIWRPKFLRRMKHAQIMDFCNDVKTLSWDWSGQTGAVIAVNGIVRAFSENYVLPYPGAIMHRGSIRERMKTPIGEHLEYYDTNHAEIGAILNLNNQEYFNNKSIIKLKECDLYTTKFPCPFCARVIAHSPIKTIYYYEDYSNRLSYEILRSAKKKVIRI